MAQQAEVKMYSTPWCPFCIRAKQLLKQKKVTFEDINVAFDQNLRNQIALETGRTSVPQIFINGEGIGGCDELYALERSNRLDALIFPNGTGP